VEIDAEPVSMSAALETVVSMVLREAITNVVRHAHAQHCSIQLYRELDEVHLVIKDDGRGGRIVPGNGLSGMRERIEQLNGRLEIHCEQGAVLSIVLPLEHKVTPIQPWNHAA
jgi:two-component system sensor histidine kinase DesK